MTARPFLMFQGDAKAALNFYVKTIPDSRILSINRYGTGEAGAEGSVKMARASICGLEVMSNDSTVKHGFSFTPSLSLFITINSEAEIDAVATALADGGSVLMPLGNYGFSRKFAWITDRFGASWQLNFE
jgi:predicted 3-demethylubiquinone-9 3-methyltransferase (glyoxalase superfamily)